MKTKIRISRYSQNGYNFINFQILDDAIEPIGSLLFQGYKGSFMLLQSKLIVPFVTTRELQE